MKKFTHDQQVEFDLLEKAHYVSKQAIQKEHVYYKKISVISVCTSLILVFISLGLCFYALETSREAKKIQEVVYQDDGRGGITVMKELHSSLNFSMNNEKMEHYLKTQLAEYVKALYSVPNSKEMRQENANKVIFMTQKDYYAKVPKDIFKSEFNTEVITGVVTVVVTTGSQVSPGVWQFNWTKKLNSDEVGKFKTWVTFKQVDIQSELIANYNPLGIVVDNIDTQADL